MTPKQKKDPGQWTVRAVYRGVAGTLIEVTPSGSYLPDEWWPVPGDTLVHKPRPKPKEKP